MGAKSKFFGGLLIPAGILTGQLWLSVAGASIIGIDELANHAS